MRNSTGASFANRVIKAVTRAVDAVVDSAEAVFAGVSPAARPVPVRVQARRR